MTVTLVQHHHASSTFSWLIPSFSSPRRRRISPPSSPRFLHRHARPHFSARPSTASELQQKAVTLTHSLLDTNSGSDTVLVSDMVTADLMLLWENSLGKHLEVGSKEELLHWYREKRDTEKLKHLRKGIKSVIKEAAVDEDLGKVWVVAEVDQGEDMMTEMVVEMLTFDGEGRLSEMMVESRKKTRVRERNPEL